MKINQYRDMLVEKGLKVTPQRLAVLKALMNTKKHPTADQISEMVKKQNPHIATGTIYKVLEALVEKGLVKKVMTEKDIMRYDAIIDEHHHLYCSKTDRIEDYFDEELNELLNKYFADKRIGNFRIEDFKLQIIGEFINK